MRKRTKIGERWEHRAKDDKGVVRIRMIYTSKPDKKVVANARSQGAEIAHVVTYRLAPLVRLIRWHVNHPSDTWITNDGHGEPPSVFASCFQLGMMYGYRISDHGVVYQDCGVSCLSISLAAQACETRLRELGYRVSK